MNAHIPNNWIPVERSYFETYLKICNDYTVDGWSNGIAYAWRHNEKRFAFDIGKSKVLVDPAILMNIKERNPMTGPQILPDSQFGRILTELASRSKLIVEIGGGCGLGSTLCLANGATSSDQKIITVEADPNNFVVLKNNISPHITALCGVISRGIKPYWHPQNLVQHREAWAAERKLVRTAEMLFDHTSSTSPLLLCSERSGFLIDSIDLLLLDGGEFCSDSDFLHLWQHAKVIALDDTNAARAVKNVYALQALVQNDWKTLHMNQDDRNGWAVFERPAKLISSNPRP